MTPRTSIAAHRRSAAVSVVLILALCGPVPGSLLGAFGAVITGLTEADVEVSGTGDGLVSIVGEFAIFGLALGTFLVPVVLPTVILIPRWIRFRSVAAYYALLGRLPWRLFRFLDDAHDRGVLRREGPTDRLAGPGGAVSTPGIRGSSWRPSRPR